MRFANKLRGVAILVATLGAGAMGVAAAAEPSDAAPTTKQEMRAQFKAMHAERRAEMLARFDANKDGKLDQAERQTMRATLSAERFKKLDTNGDGVLSLAEFQAGAQKHHGGFRFHGGKPGPDVQK